MLNARQLSYILSFLHFNMLKVNHQAILTYYITPHNLCTYLKHVELNSSTYNNSMYVHADIVLTSWPVCFLISACGVSIAGKNPLESMDKMKVS